MDQQEINNNKRYSYMGFIGAIFTLLILTVFSFLRFEQQKNANDMVSHTYMVKFKIEQTLRMVKQGEAGQRGFLISRDSAYLQSFFKARESIKTTVHELDSLASDNPGQLKNIDTLRVIVERRFKRMELVLDSTAFASPALLRPGMLMMDSIRLHTKDMQQMEDSLLEMRMRDKEKSERHVAFIILLFSILSLGVLFFTFFKMRQEYVKRTKAEIDVNLLEKVVKQRTKEIKEMNDTLTTQNIELEKRNSELASFTFMASHDLKEPLRKIQMFTDKILTNEDEPLTGKNKIDFERILGATKRMQNLIDSVFLYARTNEGITDFAQTDLNEVMKHVEETLQERIQEKGAVIRYSGLPVINALPDQIEPLFTNLVSNAIKYSKADTPPVVDVSVSKLEVNDKENPTMFPAWQIRVADNGIGFEEEYKDKIFQIFQRLHNNTLYSGTGIGLAICKKIVENHGGSISVKSSPGNGAIFTVILPVKRK